MNEAPNTKVLVGCETSGVVRQAFLDLGFDAWSCDILPSDQPSNRHIQDDVRNVLKMDSWDLVFIGHPPCTRLCNSGVQWLHRVPPNDAKKGKTLEDMWRELDEGCKLFSDLWNHSTPCLAIENPIMHKYAKERIKNFQEFSQSVQPWEFATSDDSPDNVKKRTCFWLRNLPSLEKTGTVDGSTARSEVHNAPPSEDRWKIRSKFYPELAAAMAAQWGLAAILNRRQAA